LPGQSAETAIMSELPETSHPSQTIPEGIARELDAYEQTIGRYRGGELGEIKMQKQRLQLGTYAQRQEGVQMQRIKIPGGLLSAAQLERLADAAEVYGSGFLHFTTREDVQIYYVDLGKVPELLRFLADAGITTREACGNTVRNITACYRAGTSPSEPFDVLPYAHALFRYLVRNKYNQVLGRKFKITFEGCSEDHSGVRVHDIGLVARVRREGGVEQRGFQVWLGGGLGGAPMLAHLYSEFLPEAELFNFAAATIRVFDRYGERKSRMKARMKFLVQTLGWKTFVELIEAERERVGPVPFEVAPVRAAGPEGVRTSAPSELRVLDPRADSPELERWHRDSVVAHKIPGLRGVHVRLHLGDLTSERARALARVVERFSAAELRVSIGQNLYLPWVREEDLVALHDALAEIGLADAGAETVSDVTTCPGADTCRLGIASAKGLGATLNQAFEEELGDYRELARDLKIKISGCPNGCAQHSIADIGFHAAAQTEDNRTVPAYLLFVGGKTNLGDAALGRIAGRYPVRHAVGVVRALLDAYRAERVHGEAFADWAGRIDIHALEARLAPFRSVPRFDDDPAFYRDYGHENERFAVRQGVKGECAGSTVAEVVPDFDDARERLAQAEAFRHHGAWREAQLAAYDAAADAARVPLYRRLVEPFTSEQALWEFENIFVLSGETAGAWTELSGEFEGLRRAAADEQSSGQILDLARAFVQYCGSFSGEAKAVLAAAG
jgi:sulfite reductase (ferredoxin)